MFEEPGEEIFNLPFLEHRQQLLSLELGPSKFALLVAQLPLRINHGTKDVDPLPQDLLLIQNHPDHAPLVGGQPFAEEEASLALMAALNCPSPPMQRKAAPRSIISCAMQPSQNNIMVVINGATKDIGKAAIIAVTKARGMEVAGAVDSQLVGQDAGKICGMEEALEIPIINDLTMLLGSLAQSKATGVVVDFTDPSTVYDNVKQAAAFGLRSVVYVPKIQLETIAELSGFCEKASMGCLVAPTLSIGSVLLQQAAISASFHYNNVEIVESRPDPSEFPSLDATQIANNLSDLGQMYNREDISTVNPARGQVLGEDGIRIHSLVLPGLPSSTTVHFSSPGEVYSLRHDTTNVQCLMPGLILAIRKVVRLKNLIYGLEKFL